MKKIIFFTVLLISVFNQESMCDSITEPPTHQQDDNLEIWKTNATQNVNLINNCIKEHLEQSFLIDFKERFGNVSTSGMAICIAKYPNNYREMVNELRESYEQCFIHLKKELLEKLKLLQEIDLNFVSFSRERIDSCYDNFLKKWKPQIFNSFERMETCFQETETPVKPSAEQVAKYRNDPKFTNYCVIKNGVLLNATEV